MKETARVAFRGSRAFILLSLSDGAALKVEFHQAYGRSREGVIRFIPDSSACLRSLRPVLLTASFNYRPLSHRLNTACFPSPLLHELSLLHSIR